MGGDGEQERGSERAERTELGRGSEKERPACSLVISNSRSAVQCHACIAAWVSRLCILDARNQLRQQRVFELVGAGKVNGKTALGSSRRLDITSCLH